MILVRRTASFALVFAAIGLADPGAPSRQETMIVEKYVSAAEAQAPRLRGVHMDADIDASLPKLHKVGKMNVLRHISKLGRISFVMRSFTGDNTVKKDFIARVLEAERQTSETSSDYAIVPRNYKFKYKRLTTYRDHVVHIFEVEPRKKRPGLFKGELWVDAETYLPLRESGRLVKSPSIFIKKAEFVREYEIRDGMSLPLHIESSADIRVIGKAEMRIDYSNFTWEDQQTEVAEEGSQAQ